MKLNLRKREELKEKQLEAWQAYQKPFSTYRSIAKAMDLSHMWVMKAIKEVEKNKEEFLLK